MSSLDLSTSQKSLPNSTTVLVLGILSIPLCCCFFGAVGLILSIVALMLAKKDLALYGNAPDDYTLKSYNNLKAGRICAIIGLAFSLFYCAIMIWAVATFGWEAMSDPNQLRELIELRYNQ